MPSPVFGYSKRTGVTTLRTLIRSLCKLFDFYQASITRWIDDNMTPTDANTVKAWLGALDAICILVEGTPDD